MSWLVVVTRDELRTDGLGDRQHTDVVRVAVGTPQAFDTQADAEAYARRVLNASHDPTLDVAIEPPAEHRPPAGPQRLDDRTRAAGRDGLARARALLRGDR